MSKTSKAVLSTIGAVALAAVAGYWGLNSQGDHSSTSSAASSQAKNTTTRANTTNTQSSRSTSPSSSKGNADSAGKFRSCSLSTLPKAASTVVGEIKSDGPFQYPDKDGSHFGNYQNVLPKEPSSYYREYTVDTNLKDSSRGANRIITGGGTDTDPEVWYYTSDHYKSFCTITDAE